MEIKGNIQPVLVKYAKANMREAECRRSSNSLETKEIQSIKMEKIALRNQIIQKFYPIPYDELERLTMVDIFPNYMDTKDDYITMTWRGRHYNLTGLQRRFLK
tara:strand:+ start:562 stop:870 length:309 start_codon:yes stop_codon:yes gene_type:complete